MNWLYYIMWDCALRTLAHKYGLKTRGKAIKHFGKTIVAKDQVVNKTGTRVRSTELYKPSYRINLSDFKIRGRRATTNIPQLNMKGPVSLATLNKVPCTLCNSMHKVEMHHIRMMKDLNPKLNTLDALMDKANRKQVTLCPLCHMKVHHRGLSIDKSKNI